MMTPDNLGGGQIQSRAALAQQAEPTGLSIGNYIDAPHRSGANARVRGRVHATHNDVINGIGGMEHLSNSLQG